MYVYSIGHVKINLTVRSQMLTHSQESAPLHYANVKCACTTCIIKCSGPCVHQTIMRFLRKGNFVVLASY